MNFATIQMGVSIMTTLFIPVASLWMNSIVNAAIKKADDRMTAFELKVSESMGDHKSHVKESEMRHTANEQRIDFLEKQWTALQDRTDQQQRFQHEIIRTQEGITKVLSEMIETLKRPQRS